MILIENILGQNLEDRQLTHNSQFPPMWVIWPINKTNMIGFNMSYSGDFDSSSSFKGPMPTLSGKCLLPQSPYPSFSIQNGTQFRLQKGDSWPPNANVGWIYMRNDGGRTEAWYGMERSKTDRPLFSSRPEVPVSYIFENRYLSYYQSKVISSMCLSYELHSPSI